MKGGYMPITIKAKSEGFRRCKRSFSKAPTTFADGFFSNDELQILKAEKMLIVTETQAESNPTDPADQPQPEAKSKPGKKQR
jgi:hypothetical protein